ncbi:hypothetical protein HPB51_023065 [Rhipicephalus microplus]|uniref:Uncharacterized protein n=1 Tax=Rhipicephalus microplus TaxID=6941 RepID=A0A9J6ECN6_RHIMP|nr:hypothetical protein HPB51_023065 [Rhipicephalus microplus]
MAANEAPKEVKTDESIQVMDTHLASLLQKKHDLKEAWRKNKLNRHLRTKIAEFGREIESYAKTLCAQQWNNIWDEVDGKMRRGSKWGLLKHLMTDSDKPTRCGTQLLIERLVHKHAQDSGGFQALLKTLGQKYLPLESKAVAWENKNPSYGGRLQEKLDEPFSEAEIRAAQLNTQEAWQEALKSNKYKQQLQAVQRARDVATSLRLPAPSWAEPSG